MYKKRRSSRRYSSRDFVSPGNPLGVKIPDSSSQALEKGLRTFKRQLKDSGKLEDYKLRKEYTKPTTARRKQKNDAIRRQALQHKKEVAFWGDSAWTTIVDGVPL